MGLNTTMLHLVSILSEIMLRGRVGDGPIILHRMEDATPLTAVPFPVWVMIGVLLVSGTIAVALEYRAERKTATDYSAARF